ncbi:MAG TPA: hypothetical protein VFG57_03390 [Gaiella sp.]|jgi:hypothetical protein|nr:hypothetical protein [Gaiella sp.]
MRRILVAAGVAAVAAVLTVGAASAGERTGAGGQTPIRDTARSLCAFSGLEDFDFEAPVQPGVAQNWGQIVRFAGPLGGADSTFVPGEGEIGCNAHLYPNK